VTHAGNDVLFTEFSRRDTRSTVSPLWLDLRADLYAQRHCSFYSLAHLYVAHRVSREYSGGPKCTTQETELENN